MGGKSAKEDPRAEDGAVTQQSEIDHHSMVIEWDPEDGIYVVTVPELPGCRTHGATQEEAVKNGKDAIESWIDAALAWGNPVPQPKTLSRD